MPRFSRTLMTLFPLKRSLFSSFSQHLAARYGEKVQVQDYSEEKDSQPRIQWGTTALQTSTAHLATSFDSFTELKTKFCSVSDVCMHVAIMHTFPKKNYFKSDTSFSSINLHASTENALNYAFSSFQLIFMNHWYKYALVCATCTGVFIWCIPGPAGKENPGDLCVGLRLRNEQRLHR